MPLYMRVLTCGRIVYTDSSGLVVKRGPKIAGNVAPAHDESPDAHDASCEESCWKCSGTGTYVISGRYENGKFIGRTGTCFECSGKGYITPADTKRNNNYWRYFARVS